MFAETEYQVECVERLISCQSSKRRSQDRERLPGGDDTTQGQLSIETQLYS